VGSRAVNLPSNIVAGTMREVLAKAGVANHGSCGVVCLEAADGTVGGEG
jgi:hypothetical protein